MSDPIWQQKVDTAFASVAYAGNPVGDGPVDDFPPNVAVYKALASAEYIGNATPVEPPPA